MEVPGLTWKSVFIALGSTPGSAFVPCRFMANSVRSSNAFLWLASQNSVGHFRQVLSSCCREEGTSMV